MFKMLRPQGAFLPAGGLTRPVISDIMKVYQRESGDSNGLRIRPLSPDCKDWRNAQMKRLLACLLCLILPLCAAAQAEALPRFADL